MRQDSLVPDKADIGHRMIGPLRDRPKLVDRVGFAVSAACPVYPFAGWMCAAAPCTMGPQSPRARGCKIMTTPNEALRTILPVAGWGDTQAADVMFTGGADPVLPTPFRIGAASAATLAASGLAATELWQARSGRRQRVTVDLRQATAALRSSHYIQLAGTGVSSARNTIMGFYPTRDGRWSYLHCNFRASPATLTYVAHREELGACFRAPRS